MVIENTEKNDFQLKNSCNKCNVEDRLLDAAEKLFCENGFDGTTVRDLTAEAGCNVAAVNYHFNGKEQLYKAMFIRHLEWVLGFYRESIEDVMNLENPTVEKLIYSLVSNTLKQTHSEESKIPMLKLTIRECLNPKFEKDVKGIEIVKEFLSTIQRALMTLFPAFNEEKAMLCVFSLEGMIIHPLLFSDIYHDIIEGLNVDKLTDHLVQFASDGIKQAAKSNE